MQMKYDHQADALYIRLTDNPVLRSKQVSPNVALDIDEQGEVIGIEVLSVRKSGIDPLAVEFINVPDATAVERPDSDEIRRGRVARMEALKRQRQKQTHDAG